MKLRQKLVAWLRSQNPAASRGGRSPVAVPGRRPTPLEDGLGSLNPAGAWGTTLEPAERVQELVAALIEQLALEAYLNGPTFEFGLEELEGRFRDLIERRVAAGELSQGAPGTARVEPAGWLTLQKERIERLVAWWRAQGGPDIEPRVL